MTEQDIAEATPKAAGKTESAEAPPAAGGPDDGSSPGEGPGGGRVERADPPTDSTDGQDEVKYDFARPWTISNKFHRNLASIAEAFANQLGFTMSNYLRTSVDVTFESVKQELFKDYLDRMPERKCIGVFSIEPLGGQSVVTADGEFMFVILDKLIGGQGMPHVVSREFTELEVRVFMLVLNKVLNDLREAAKKFFESSVNLNRIESNPAFIAVMTGGEKVIAITVNMVIGEHAGTVMVAIPMSGFDPVMSALDPKEEAFVKRSEIPAEDREKIYQALNETSVEVTAVLGNSTITLDRLLDLEVGDTVMVNRQINDPIDLRIGKKTVRRGQPGKSQNRKAVRIV